MAEFSCTQFLRIDSAWSVFRARPEIRVYGVEESGRVLDISTQFLAAKGPEKLALVWMEVSLPESPTDGSYSEDTEVLKAALADVDRFQGHAERETRLVLTPDPVEVARLQYQRAVLVHGERSTESRTAAVDHVGHPPSTGPFVTLSGLAAVLGTTEALVHEPHVLSGILMRLAAWPDAVVEYVRLLNAGGMLPAARALVVDYLAAELVESNAELESLSEQRSLSEAQVVAMTARMLGTFLPGA